MKKTAWTEAEDRLLFDLHRRLGNRWAEIAKVLHGRLECSHFLHKNSALKVPEASDSFAGYYYICRMQLREFVLLSVCTARSAIGVMMSSVCDAVLCQDAYKSGKPGNLREFCKSGKLREFEMYSGNFWSPLLSATKM